MERSDVEDIQDVRDVADSDSAGVATKAASFMAWGWVK